LTGKDVKPGINGGIVIAPYDYPHGTGIQIEVDSIDEAISNAKNNGAMIVRDKMEFDDFFLAYLVDPVGIGFGLIRKNKKGVMKGNHSLGNFPKLCSNLKLNSIFVRFS